MKITERTLEETSAAYLTEIPEAIPSGKIIVHNHVKPSRTLGANGFRAWLAEPEPQYEPCPCRWAPELGTHYRVRGIGNGGNA